MTRPGPHEAPPSLPVSQTVREAPERRYPTRTYDGGHASHCGRDVRAPRNPTCGSAHASSVFRILATGSVTDPQAAPGMHPTCCRTVMQPHGSQPIRFFEGRGTAAVSMSTGDILCAVVVHALITGIPRPRSNGSLSPPDGPEAARLQGHRRAGPHARRPESISRDDMPTGSPEFGRRGLTWINACAGSSLVG